MAVLVERDHIGIFGRMNAGKSSVMNLLTQQETSIVDATPGTTADTKLALTEIHGMGPVKLYDTAGADESTGLGEKKRRKVFNDLKECDLVLLVVDPDAADFPIESEIVGLARSEDKQLLVIYNLFRPEANGEVGRVETAIPRLRFHRKLALSAVDPDCRQPLLDFILENYESRNRQLPLLPFLEPDRFYVLIIPMDVETPPGRYLRPQAMVEEYITRNWAYPVSFRLDLGKARSPDEDVREAERRRLLALVNGLGQAPQAIVTDSQALDVVHPWCPRDVQLTTFSIVMINYMSGGRLAAFADGAQAIDTLHPGDRILIAEACNHSRIGEDIGTVQIPRYLEERVPGLHVEHSFGREFQDNPDLARYRLVIHCGGCMVSRQKIVARLRDLEAVGVPYTNYGVALARFQGQATLEKVLEPWGLDRDDGKGDG